MNKSYGGIDKRIIEYLETSSVHLVRLGSENLPGGIASGLLIDYKGKRFLCTAAHCLSKGPLSLQIEWSNEHRATKTRLLNLEPVYRFSGLEALAADEFDELDFAFCEIPFDDVPLHQELDDNLSGTVKNARECKIYTESDLALPAVGKEYGFFGHVRPKYEPFPHPIASDDVRYLNAVGRWCYPLTYLHKVDGFFAFQSPVEIVDHDDFKGCSGAPIVDSDGHVVALVCSGNSDNSIIYGFPIQEFAAIFDILVSGILVEPANQNSKRSYSD